METKTDIQNTRTLGGRTSALLDQGRIRDAITLLTRSAKGIPPLPQQVENIESTYSLLTKYFLDGVRDDSRDAMLEDLQLQLLDIADQIDRHHRIPEDRGTYYAEARMLSYRPQSLQSLLHSYKDLNEKVALKNELGSPDIAEMRNREALLDKIFNYVWTLGYGAKNDLKIIRDQILSSEQQDSILAYQLVSALMLAALEWYDREKLTTLLSVYESSATEALAARALTALVLVIAKYRNRISSDTKLMHRFETLKDSLLTYRRLRESVRSIIRTRDTDRVVTKMRSEVIPGMMKLSPDLIKKMKEISEEGDLEALEENPEWEEMMMKTGLADRMRELTEMQMEGADVMMVAFSNLKSFPFFSKISNWFLPFTTDISIAYEGDAARMLADSDGMSKLLETDGIMCDSDKFSFLFALASMPKDRREAMTMQLDAQKRQMEESGMTNTGSNKPEYDIETENFIRDLYRFFKLYPKKDEFDDPFLSPLDFQNLPVVSDIFNEQEILELFAAFYFKRGYYKEAVPLLRQLSEVKGDDPHTWEKLGYALEQTGENPTEVLACYMKAELLSPDSRWLARRIGKAYAATGKWALAEDYLSRAADDTQKVSDLMELAEVKRLAGNIEGAAKDMYKANYLEPDNRKVRFALARLEMERGELEKALKFARPRGDENLSDEEYRLLGHIYLLNKEYRKAAETYSLTIRPEHTHREWKKAILNEWPLIESLGADRRDLNLILDSLI